MFGYISLIKYLPGNLQKQPHIKSMKMAENNLRVSNFYCKITRFGKQNYIYRDTFVKVFKNNEIHLHQVSQTYF